MLFDKNLIYVDFMIKYFYFSRCIVITPNYAEKKKQNKTHPYRMYLTYSILCKLKCHRIKLSLSDFFIVKITNIYRI